MEKMTENQPLTDQMIFNIKRIKEEEIKTYFIPFYNKLVFKRKKNSLHQPNSQFCKFLIELFKHFTQIKNQSLF